MADGSLQYLIQLGIDPQTAQQAVDGVDKFRAGLDKAKQSAQKLVEEGRKMSELGATMAMAGAAVLAPLVAAADTYVSRYKGIESAANAFTAAQQRQTEATTNLGRAAATALIPVMNQAADITQKIADFATAHPDLMSAGVNIAGTMVVAGGAIAAAGQLASTVGRVSELINSGGLVGNLGKAAVGVAAIGVGTEVAIAGLNAFGKATGDARLATYGLGDAFNTVKQIIAIPVLLIAKAFVEAEHTVEMFGGIIQAVGLIVGRDFDTTVNGVRTGFEAILGIFHDGIASVINILIDAFAGIVAAVPGGGQMADKLKEGKIALDGVTSALKDGALRQIDINKKYDAADQAMGDTVNQIEANYQNNLKNLSTFATGVNGVVTGAGGAGGSQDVPTPTGKLPAEVTKAYIEYQKQLAASEKQYGQERLDAQTAFNQDSIKTELDYQNNVAKQKADANRKSHEEDVKALIDFNHNEALIKKKADFDRLQSQKQFNASQLELAAQGDVAGYISAQKSHNFDMQQQDRQNAYDATTRKQQFEWDQQQKHAEDAQSLKDSLADLALQHSQEIKAKAVAYADQLKQLDNKHELEKKALETAFATQIADLTSNVAGLNKIQSDFYTQQESAATAFVVTQTATLQKLYAASIGAPAPTSTVTPGSFLNIFNPGIALANAGYSPNTPSASTANQPQVPIPPVTTDTSSPTFPFNPFTGSYRAVPTIPNRDYSSPVSPVRTPMSMLGGPYAPGRFPSASQGQTFNISSITIGAGNNVTKDDVHAAITSSFGQLRVAIAGAK